MWHGDAHLAAKGIWSALPEYELCAQLFFHPTHTNHRLHLDAKGLAGALVHESEEGKAAPRGERHQKKFAAIPLRG